MLIPFEKLKSLLENVHGIPDEPPLISTTKDSQNKLNKILRPQGIIVQDTWNNFIFPIRPKPKIDTSKFDTAEVIKQFRNTYSTFPSMFLPWHFVVEMIGDRYYVIQMRPIDTKFPMSNEEVINAKHYFENDVTKNFFEKPVYQIDQMLHICIVGDSTTDIYSNKIYRQIGRICIAPYFRNMFITGGYEERIFNFNLGDRFNFSNLSYYARR
jgi:hypothetical protein